MIVAGLDWSMTCPAICVYDTKKPLTFSNCSFFFLTDKKKYDGSFKNVHGFKMPLYDSDEERFDIISSWAMTILRQHGVKQACLEGYSMGSKGKVFHIAENIGLLKHKMWAAKLAFITPAPTAVKKQFTGKGNANKEAMYDELRRRCVDTDLEVLLDCKASDSPISDIVDSFAMTDFLINNPDVK